MEHTPGPWVIDDEMVMAQLETEKGIKYYAPIADCNVDNPKNINLIAAAPELLKACKASLDMVRNCPGNWQTQTHDLLIKAITKAEGK